MNCLKTDLLRRISIAMEKRGHSMPKEEYDELAAKSYAELFIILEKELKK